MPHAEEISVSAWLNFHSSDTYPANQPREIYLGTAGDKLRKHEPHLVQVTDLRTSSQDFKLDANGFQFVLSQSSLSGTDFQSDDLVKETYYAEVEALLRFVTGASKVKIGSHLVRYNNFQDVIKEAEELNAKEGPRAYIKRLHPAMNCHVDRSFSGARQALDQALPEQAEELSKQRWGIVNVWCPIKPVERDPLAVCDWRSVNRDKDLVGVDLIMPGKEEHAAYGRIHGKIAGQKPVMQRWDVAYNADQKWYYATHMQPEECLLVKCFDSKNGGTAKCALHTAFAPTSEEGLPRESVECRCFLFWDDENTA